MTDRSLEGDRVDAGAERLKIRPKNRAQFCGIRENPDLSARRSKTLPNRDPGGNLEGPFPTQRAFVGAFRHPPTHCPTQNVGRDRNGDFGVRKDVHFLTVRPCFGGWLL